MKTILARIWTKENCRFAAPATGQAVTPESLRITDPRATAWMYLNGDLHQGTAPEGSQHGISHVELARDLMKGGRFNEGHVKALMGEPPMGRISSDGKSMALWFKKEQALKPPFSQAILELSSGLNPEMVLYFTDSSQKLGAYMHELMQRDMNMDGLS
jgi:hypothetical protein